MAVSDAGEMGTHAGGLQHHALTHDLTPGLHMTDEDVESWHRGSNGKSTEQAVCIVL